MKIIAIQNYKGGSGKTVTSHLIALGCGWFERPAYLLHTDFKRPRKLNNRPYHYIDARELETLKSVFEKLANVDGEHWAIIDSGGNRHEFDAWLAPHVDLVLIPVHADEEAIEEALLHYEEIKNDVADVRFIVRESGNAGVRDKTLLSQIPKNLILGGRHFPEVKATQILKMDDKEVFKSADSTVNNLSRNIYRALVEHFNPTIDL